MKVLVTGAAGFIGYHTSEALLARGVEVVGLDNLNTYYDVRLTAPILSVVLTSIFLAVLIHAVQVPGQTAFSGPEYRAMSNERTSDPATTQWRASGNKWENSSRGLSLV